MSRHVVQIACEGTATIGEVRRALEQVLNEHRVPSNSEQSSQRVLQATVEAVTAPADVVDLRDTRLTVAHDGQGSDPQLQGYVIEFGVALGAEVTAMLLEAAWRQVFLPRIRKIIGRRDALADPKAVVSRVVVDASSTENLSAHVVVDVRVDRSHLEA